ncbi:MAG: S-adenosylmethionine synthetase [Candidatus Marinamargulisbacteria bacterium]
MIDLRPIMSYFFSSESVSEGHPDKLCDQISDAILDEALKQDPESRVAAECFATTGLIVVGGEITSTAVLDIQKIVRKTVREIGYTDAAYGIDADSCCVMSTLHEQSPDIAQGVNKGEGLHKALGAGDQGMMFGYACTQTPVYMPLPIYLAHKLVKGLADLRKSGTLPYLRPDSKAQVTVEYEGRKPIRIDTVVISTQHNPEVEQDEIHQDLKKHLIQEVVPADLLDENTKYLINPTGRFVIGGPHGDTGLTGRKIIVDTYGGWGAHGGGAFSGKDCTKVDRCGAYMARYVAKNVVAAGLADEIEIQIAYAIGVADPVSIRIDTRNTATTDDSTILGLIRDHFDFTPEGIIDTLGLKQPIFRKTAAYGHFGREDTSFGWEKLDKVEVLKNSIQEKTSLGLRS